jgi:hypothetical protein
MEVKAMRSGPRRCSGEPEVFPARTRDSAGSSAGPLTRKVGACRQLSTTGQKVKTTVAKSEANLMMLLRRYSSLVTGPENAGPVSASFLLPRL